MKKLFFLILFLAINSSLFAKHNILIINSYHQHFSWTDSLVKNIINNLPYEEFYIEYMDTKRFHRKMIFKIFRNFISKKYRNKKIDLIIVTDNNALEFVVTNKKKIFKNIPVLFCGINNFRYPMLKGYKDITGVVEGVDIGGTIKAILKIHPGIKYIIAITGANFTAQLYFYRIVKWQYFYRDVVNIKPLNGLFYRYDEFTKELRNLPKNSVILYANLFRLRDGTIFGIGEGINYIFKNSNKPIYLMWDIMMNYPGVVGGKITSAKLQSLSVVNYAKKILYEKIPPQKLPVITKPPTEYVFDYKELKRFNIDFNRLPKPYRLINEPPQMYKELKRKEKEIRNLYLFLAALIIILSFLFYNIIKRKQIEKKLESENLQFLTLLNGLHDLIIQKDPEDKWIYINNEAKKFFNIDLKNYKNKKTNEIFKENKEFIKAFGFDKYVWDKKISCRETISFYKNSEKIFLDIIKIPIFNPDGTKKCMIITCRDITSLKRLEQSLINAQKLDAIGKLAGGIAHDFNNILTSISTNAELCQYLITDEKLKKYLNNIIRSTENASLLTRRLLSLGKKNVRNIEILEVNSTIKSLVELLRSSIPENIKLILETYNEPLPIKVDPSQFEQIITNLVLNSKDAVLNNKKSEKIIKINISKVFYKSENKNYVKIMIEDNGPGIDEKIKDKIFDPFFTTKEEKGTGLGLSTVLNLLEQNNGFIEWETERGCGTTFSIYFPLIVEKIEINEKINNLIDEIDFTVKINKTILFVEDDIKIIDSLDENFIKIFKKFIIAKNGVDALNKVKNIEKEIDILITDIVMPEMDGIALAKKLKKLNPNIKVIFVSGYDSGKLVEKLPFQYKYLYKPYPLKKLLNLIND